MYRCEDCGRYFYEHEMAQRHTTYETSYGVSGLFNTSNDLTIDVCPYCGSEWIEEIEEEEEDE